MIISIKRDGDIEEWAIIELQGDLKFDTADPTNKYIGDLHFSTTGVPIFIIGIHVLHGKEVDLPKPFAVLLKKNCEKENSINNSVMRTEYVVKAIVKKKLVFKSRPKPIVINAPKCN